MENVEGWTSLLFLTMGEQGVEDANETQEEMRKSCKVKKWPHKMKNSLKLFGKRADTHGEQIQ